MVEIMIIILILLAVVGFMVADIVRNRGKQPATLERTMSFNPETDTVLPQSTQVSEFENKPCVLAVTLRIIGIINIFASFIIAMICGSDYSWLIAVVVILSGCLGAIFCYALQSAWMQPTFTLKTLASPHQSGENRLQVSL